MINIKDVAKISGYSIGTVSKALNDYPDINEKTKQKIKDIATDLDDLIEIVSEDEEDEEEE